MPFVSFAQNFEDVMLWRALKSIDKGFYVDVGAFDSEICSVTKAFYDRGWQGINIEPIVQYYERLKATRPNDVNLNIACAKKAETRSLYEVSGTGLSTFDKNTAERHREEHGFKIIERKVVTRTLTDVLEEYGINNIQFMKIDVEGAEKEVLEGLDLRRFRPWIIIVESTLPNQEVDTSYIWEHLLTNMNYIFTYFDGVNRYYIDQNHANLQSFFSTPPNFFDDFVSISLVRMEQRASAAERHLSAVERNLKAAHARAENEARYAAQVEKRTRELADQLAQASRENCEAHLLNLEKQKLCGSLEAEVRALRESTSWRITAPLRWIKRHLLIDSGDVVRWAMSKPGLVKFVHSWVDLAPPLRAAIAGRVRKAVAPPIQVEPMPQVLAEETKPISSLLDPDVSPHTRLVRNRIKGIIRERRAEV